MTLSAKRGHGDFKRVPRRLYGFARLRYQHRFVFQLACEPESEGE